MLFYSRGGLLSDKENAAKENAVTMSKDMIYGLAIAVLAILLLASVFTSGFDVIKPNTQTGQGNETGTQKLSDAVLKSKLETYINQNLLGDGYTAEVTKFETYDDHIQLATLNIKQGSSVLQTAQAYITNDGNSMFLGEAIRLNESVTPPDNQNNDPTGQTETEVVKAEKPKAQAFVMAFCPYGLQFLKAYVPVMELLGDKADLEIHFVDYAMHGKDEIDGNSYIYCVQKEEKAKLNAYLRCFLESGDYTACVATANINSTKIDTCVSQLDTQYNLTGMFNDQSTWASGYYPLYPVETDLNDQYGVRGSPTFVLNGEQVAMTSANKNLRSAEELKKVICSSFITPPAECDTALRTETEAAGLGAVASGTSTSAASCG
jgi:protein-disulfide isomerase